MGLTFVAAVIALSAYPSRSFCPLAPSPQAYTDNVGLRFKNGHWSNEPLSARVAARLIDTRAGEDSPTIGWLYLDEDGNEYIVLRPYVRRDIYVGFHMDRYNHFRPDTNTEVNLQQPLHMPAGVEIRSCTLPD